MNAHDDNIAELKERNAILLDAIQQANLNTLKAIELARDALQEAFRLHEERWTK